VLAASGTYALRTRYTILSASNGISSAFSGVTSNVALLRPSLSYDPNNVYLDLTRTGFAAAAQSGNQRTVGNVLDQAASSLTNFAFGVFVARTVGPAEFGARALRARRLSRTDRRRRRRL